MRLVPHSFNSFLFQQTNKVTGSFEYYDWDISGISTNSTARNQNRPKYSGKIYGGDVKVVTVVLNDINADKDSLIVAMDVAGDQQHPLYATDEFGKTWYCNAVCTGLNTETVDGNTGQFGYTFECDDPTWVEVVEESETWNITATGDTHTVTVDGNQISRPTFEFTPGAPPAYYPFKQYVKNYNPIGLAQTDAVDITNGGWNTAALVAAGKMLATGYDCRVIFDGAEIPRWVGGGGWNNASTQIFIRQTWQSGQFMPLKTALAGAGTPVYIEWAVTAAVKTALGKLPKNDKIRVGTEEISYKNLSVALCRAEIVERNIRGTSIAAHAIGAVCWWVEHDIQVIYGNAAATAPVYDDTYKPVINMATSTNASRVYAEFADAAGLRAGSFKRLVLNDGLGKASRVYSGNQAAIEDVDPVTDMGMEIASYLAQGRAKAETADLAWQFYHPAGIDSVTVASGEKWKAFATTSWPAVAGLMSSKNGVVWVSAWNDVVPALAATWTALTHTVLVAMPAGTKYIRFRLNGSVNALVANYARLEIDACTVALTSANLIQVGLNGEIANYQFSFEVRNITTGESLLVDYPASQGNILKIDSEAMTVTYKGMNAINGISQDTIRTEWLKLIRGANVLLFTASATGNVAAVIKHHNRSL